MMKKAPRRRNRSNPNSRLRADDLKSLERKIQVIDLTRQGETQQSIARRVGVTRQSVGEILHRFEGGALKRLEPMVDDIKAL